MIRVATRFDADEVAALMRQFRAESPLADVYGNDEEHFAQLFTNILAGQGVIFIAEGKGLMMGIILPSIWSGKVMALHELAWYVKPEHRNSTVGARLFKAYVEHGKQLKANGRISFFTVSKMVSSPTLKYEKHGFRKIDENWIQ